MEVFFIHLNSSYNTGTLCLYLEIILDPPVVLLGPMRVQVLLHVRDIVQVPLGGRGGLVRDIGE